MWLLENSIHEAMTSAPAPTAQQIQMVMDRYAQDDCPGQRTGMGYVAPSGERVMTVVGSTAQIDIVGILTQAPDFMAMFFGGGNTLYGDIVEAVNSAEADNNIDTVDFFFRSPGGQASPVAGVGDLIAGMQKPTRAVVDSAHSAAMWLATQCSTIVATTRGSTFGSIGAVVGYRKPSESPFVEITSTQAPRKRPNPETVEGINIVREELDVLHQKFAEAVAAGRSTTVENVNTNYGQGGTLIADQALAVGMIDEIAAAPTRSVAPSEVQGPEASAQPEILIEPKGAKTMDLATLLSEHKGLHDQVFASGKEAGKAEELDRVKFHATMGESTGAMDIAMAACKAGTAKDDGETQAKYLTAARNGSELSEREKEEKELADNNPAADADEAKKAAFVKQLFVNNNVNY